MQGRKGLAKKHDFLGVARTQKNSLPDKNKKKFMFRFGETLRAENDSVLIEDRKVHTSNELF